MANLYVISGPSGVGKDTLVALVFERIPSLENSVSVTTRKPRPGELEGREYFFKSKDEVLDLINNNGLIEWNEYADNIYGTPKKFIDDKIAEGKSVLLSIDVNGASNVKSVYPKAKTIFITPPSKDELKRRLLSRGTETEEQINSRLDIVQFELDRIPEFDKLVINDNLDRAADELVDFINKSCDK